MKYTQEVIDEAIRQHTEPVSERVERLCGIWHDREHEIFVKLHDAVVSDVRWATSDEYLAKLCGVTAVVQAARMLPSPTMMGVS